MQKALLGLFLTTLLFSVSCSKDEKCPYTDDPVTVPAAEITALEDYLASKGITNATKDARGFYYRITTPGSGTTPGVCNSIAVNYVGKLTNDAIFDQTTTSPVSFVLGEVIKGWVKGIPLIKPGGKITLYLPPSLAYGSATVGPIPPNSILIFDVELLGVQ
ncbi:MAG: FKBP-type peptidyl-prolyl cis-trans isomerase [Chitinophagaceae bacterium]|jgi:FKBP-type peptidyl-prolyl cis-trans isomerase|nr:FKBP-type peptidyl-prolyl cis-trans isomerase [Chitinophagaceae bacterium]